MAAWYVQFVINPSATWNSKQFVYNLQKTECPLFPKDKRYSKVFFKKTCWNHLNDFNEIYIKKIVDTSLNFKKASLTMIYFKVLYQSFAVKTIWMKLLFESIICYYIFTCGLLATLFGTISIIYLITNLY